MAHSTITNRVPALTPYTCGLACLESYFSDIGRPLDQCEILKKYPQYVTNSDPSKFNEFGATSDTQLVDLCRHLAFVADRYEDLRQDVVDDWFDRWLARKFCVLPYWHGHCVSNPTGRMIWKRVVKSTLSSNRISQRIDDLRHTIEAAIIRTPYGVLGANKLAFTAAPIERFLTRLTKGLVSIYHPEVNRDALFFHITQIDQFKLNSIILSGVAKHFKHFSVGKGVYKHWRAFGKEDTHLGMWVHVFYDSSTWLVAHSRDQEELASFVAATASNNRACETNAPPDNCLWVDNCTVL